MKYRKIDIGRTVPAALINQMTQDTDEMTINQIDHSHNGAYLQGKKLKANENFLNNGNTGNYPDFISVPLGSKIILTDEFYYNSNLNTIDPMYVLGGLFYYQEPYTFSHRLAITVQSPYTSDFTYESGSLQSHAFVQYFPVNGSSFLREGDFRLLSPDSDDDGDGDIIYQEYYYRQSGTAASNTWPYHFALVEDETERIGSLSGYENYPIVVLIGVIDYAENYSTGSNRLQLTANITLFRS